MPSGLRLPDGSYMRHLDVQRIMEHLYAMKCVEVTGFSNLGKSSLLRLLAQPDVWLRELGEAGSEFLPVYVDCNRMLEMTDQGFYELVLRCLQESSDAWVDVPDLMAAYETLIAPASEFQVPLSFNKGLTAALQSSRRKLVLLFDEFDEPFVQIDSRVFLNLRAKKDRYGENLVYVTATVRSLNELRPGDHCDEFCELFIYQPWHLAPLTLSDVERYVRSYAAQNELPLIGADVDFIHQWSGGHPGLMQGVCRILATAIQADETVCADDAADHWSLHRSITAELRHDPSLYSESEKIWQSCSQAEQETLMALFAGQDADEAVVEALQQRHILLEVEGERRPFCRHFAEHIQHKLQLPETQDSRLWVDVDSGEVLIDGESAEILTKLEYQLMLLLFKNVEKIVDKYQIVTGVWGEEYIDEVDDARIEKLVSRLRQKIEPDPSSPRFITTVRGRGYRLVLS